MERLIKAVASLFYIGYLPIAPGSFGSLVGVGIWYGVGTNVKAYVVLTVFFIVVGFLISGKAEKVFGQRDSKRIVIDEMGGAAVTFLLIPPKITYLLVGFLIFRLFDIVKLYPSNKLENLPGSIGVMSDDLIAGIYANLCLRIVMQIV